MLLLCGARDQPSRLITRSDFVQHVGADNVVPHVRAALARAARFSRISRESAASWRVRWTPATLTVYEAVAGPAVHDYVTTDPATLRSSARMASRS